MPLIGELKTRVALYGPQDVKNKFGQAQTGHVLRGAAWAKLELLDVRDESRFRQAGLKASAKLTIRFNRDVTGEWQVEFEGARYSIESVAQEDRRWTVLLVSRENK